MSTVFYGYRFPKKDLWEVVEYIRKYYDRTHPLLNSDNLVKMANEFLDDPSKYGQILDTLHKLSSNMKTTLQLFEIADDYVMRVLESGYFFMNNYKTMFPEGMVVSVFYDDRSDLLDDAIFVKPVVDTIEVLIENREYLLYPLVDENVVSDSFFEKVRGK